MCERVASMAERPVDWTVTRLAGAPGAEVKGLDIDSVSESDIATIKSLLLEHMVLFFPGQSPTVDAQAAFGRHFGKLEGNPNLKNAFLDCPEVLEPAAEQGGVADEWHTDITFQDNPALMSVLHMVECPEVGGDTMLSRLCAACEGLSQPMREICDGLTALHDALPHNHPEQTR